MRNKLVILLIIIFLLGALIFLSTQQKADKSKVAETSASQSNTNKAETLNERAEKRWKALIARDWKAAYAFETPSYRKSFTLEQFRSNFGGAVTWKSAKVVKIEAISDKATDVGIELRYLFSEGGSGEMLIPTFFKERWLKSDGQWWHVTKNK